LSYSPLTGGELMKVKTQVKAGRRVEILFP
jgi:hypothetical protein